MSRTLDLVRVLVTESTESRYSMARGSGVSQSVLSRLVNGHRGISLETADRILDHLGFELTIQRKRRRRREM